MFGVNCVKMPNDRKIARIAWILTIFGPNRVEQFSNERHRHCGIVVVVIVDVVVTVVVVVGDFRWLVFQTRR